MMIVQSPPLRSPRRRGGCCGSRRVQTGLLLVVLVLLCALFLSEDVALGAGASLRSRGAIAANGVSTSAGGSRVNADFYGTDVTDSWKAALSSSVQHFADAAAALAAAQTQQLQSFRRAQRQKLDEFLREQKLFRDFAASEFAVAEAAIAAEQEEEDEARRRSSRRRSPGDGGGGGDDIHNHNTFGISGGDVATTTIKNTTENASRATDRDTWAFMIPVIQTNPRRQARLVKNLCALSWPPKVGGWVCG